MKKIPKIRRKNKLENTSSVSKELLKNSGGTNLPDKSTRRLRIPMARYSHKERAGVLAHHLLSLALPIAVYVLVAFFRLHYVALGLILFSKWQIFLVKPRFWWANLKFSAVDLIFKLSILGLLVQSEIKIEHLINKNALVLHILQILLTGVYVFWNLYLRKLSSALGMRAQAMLAQALALSTLSWAAGFALNSLPLPLLIGVSWVVTYSAAQHTLYAYEEPSIHQLASFWAIFATTLSFLQLIWAKNFILFGSLIYIPLMPLVLSGFAYLAVRAHSLIEQTQDETELATAVFNKKKDELVRGATAACVASIFLAILIALG